MLPAKKFLTSSTDVPSPTGFFFVCHGRHFDFSNARGIDLSLGGAFASRSACHAIIARRTKPFALAGITERDGAGISPEAIFSARVVAR